MLRLYAAAVFAELSSTICVTASVRLLRLKSRSKFCLQALKGHLMSLFCFFRLLQIKSNRFIILWNLCKGAIFCVGVKTIL